MKPPGRPRLERVYQRSRRMTDQTQKTAVIASASNATTAPSAEDLVAVWEEHLRQEFAARNPDGPTDTMAPEPYVNHVPTMTGGLGVKEVKRFYKYHFVTANPEDIEIVPI